jgi:hypothetical protein
MKRFDTSAVRQPSLALLATGAHADDEEVSTEEVGPALDLVFCIDVSGSMGSYLPIIKPTILSLIRHAVRRYPGRKLRLGLVRYGDGNRRYLVHDLSEDQPRFLQELRYDRFLGAEEYVGDVLKKSVEMMKWSENSVRRIYVLGNESAQQGPTSLDAALRAARDKSITISTAYCACSHPRAETSDAMNVRNWFGAEWQVKAKWIELARVGGGDYLQVVSKDGYVLPGTPPLLAVAWDGETVARFADYIQVASLKETMLQMRDRRGRSAGMHVGGTPIEHSVMRYYAMHPEAASYLLRPS